MAKETKELGLLIGKTVNAVVESLKPDSDGVVRLNLADLKNFLDPILAGGPAIEGIALVGRENALAPIPEREEVKKGFSGTLSSANASDQYDISEIFGGALAIYRISYNLGKAAGEKAILADIKAGKIPMEDLFPDSE